MICRTVNDEEDQALPMALMSMMLLAVVCRILLRAACSSLPCNTITVKYQSYGSGFIESGYENRSGSSISSESGSGSNPDPAFWWPNTDEKVQLKIFLYIFFWSKIAIYLCPSYSRSLQPSLEKMQHFKKMKFINCFYICGSFLPSWIQICNPEPDTDPGTPLNRDPIRIQIHNTAEKIEKITADLVQYSLRWFLTLFL
jgi:hypothetical protein